MTNVHLYFCWILIHDFVIPVKYHLWNSLITFGGDQVAVIQPCSKEDTDTPPGSSPSVPRPIATVTDYLSSHVQSGDLKIHRPSTTTPSMTALKINNQNKV